MSSAIVVSFLLKPSGDARSFRAVTAPDLEGSYGIHEAENSFVNDEGEKIPKDQLAKHLTQYISNMKDEGNEWGWEFKSQRRLIHHAFL